MTSIMRVVSRWTGFNGAPGYTNFFFRDFDAGDGAGSGVSAALATSAMNRTVAFWDGMKAVLPNVVRIAVDPTVDVLEDTTGELIDSYGITPPAAVAGTSANAFSGPVGIVVNWKTSGIRNGRRIAGRTFIVPISNANFGTTGGLLAGVATSLVPVAAALADPTKSPDLGVWARPTAKGATDGKWAPVTSSNIPALAAVLRSRRD